MNSRVHRLVIGIGLTLLAISPACVSAGDGATALPWTEQELRETLTNGTKIVYSRSGDYPWGLEVGAGATHTFEVSEATQESLFILNTWDDPEQGGFGNNSATWSWEQAFFLNSYSVKGIEVIGEEQVETPAGTFDTVVVEVNKKVSEEWPKHTYWLITDQPGVYAKFMEHQTDEASYVMVLQNVVRP